MSAAMIGALAGLLLAGIEMILLRKLARRVDLPETKQVLNVVGKVQLALFPVVGWFVADAIGGK